VRPRRPSELQTLFDWLILHDLLWTYVERGDEPHGFPDVLVFDVAYDAPVSRHSTAIILKLYDPDHHTYSLSAEQAQWAGELVERGWEVLVGNTCGEVIRTLVRLGYGMSSRCCK